MPAKKQLRKGGRKQNKHYKKKRSYGLVKGDVAQTTVNLGSITLGANATYGAYNFALSNSARAMQVAQAYQYYRIRKITVKVKPLYDTYASGGTAAVPNLYTMIDRSRTLQLNSSLTAIKNMGAKPRRLDDKNLTWSFAPAVNVLDISSPATAPGGPVGLQPGRYSISPWLPTNANASVTLGSAPWAANSIDHAGFLVALEQWGTVTQTGPLCSCEFIVEYEFKKRLWYNPASSEPTREIDLDTMTIVLTDPPSEPLKTQ